MDSSSSSSSLLSAFFFFFVFSGERELYYQFFITSPVSFLVNVFDAENNSVRTLFGKKELNEPERSFFQKYSSMMMMMGVMVVMQYFKRQAPAAEGEAPAAAPATPAATN
jgi:hypothetical protein